MRSLRKIFSLVILLVLPVMMFAQAYDHYHWVPFESTENNMTPTYSISIEGTPIGAENYERYEMGVFFEEKCRTSYRFVCSPFHTYVSWGYNCQGNPGEKLTFKLYDIVEDVELDLVTDYDLTFVPDAIIGNAVTPFFIDFHAPVSESYYMLVTDESQLVSGGQYIIANGFDGDVKAIGLDDDSGERASVEVAISNRKAFIVPASSAADERAYEFTLGGTSNEWTLYDVANAAYMATSKRGNLVLADVANVDSKWSINVSPTGYATFWNENRDNYLYYDSSEDSYYCDEETPLCIFAKCELINGEIADLEIDDASKIYVVTSGNTLSVGALSTVSPNNLIVEDGAQFIGASVIGGYTVQKSIESYASVDSGDDWYTISSPLATSVENVSNLLFPDYDLYYFKEDIYMKEWRNYKDGQFSNLESGRGYLYANSNDLTLNFVGNINESAATYNMTYSDFRPDDLKGFALIGNPFAFDIQKGSGAAIDDDRLSTGYYSMNHSGNWEVFTDEMPIKPCQGILIQTAEAGQLAINRVVAAAHRGMSKGNVSVEVEGDKGYDRVFVYFNECRNLTKINHFNTQSPILYLREDDKRFAIAHEEALNGIGEVPVFFESPAEGNFRLTVKNNGLHFSYLHLIDNLTGTDQDLLENNNYLFNVHSSDYASRFKLVYRLNDGADNEETVFCYYANGRLNIPDIDDEGMLEIIDVVGRIVYTENVSGNYSKELPLKDGLYIVKLNDKTQKIVLK